MMPFSFDGLVKNYSVKRDDLVYVFYVKPKAENDLQNERFFRCMSFCSNALS